jgi:hypothetical protein
MTTPGPTGTTPANAEHAANRRSDKFVALIAVVGVVVGGLIGAGASLYATASQSRQSLDNYRRDQRTEVYAQLSDAIDKLSLETIDLATPPPGTNFFNPDGTPAEVDMTGFEDALTATLTVLTKASVAASTDVMKAATLATWDQTYLFSGSVGLIDTTQRSVIDESSQILVTPLVGKSYDVFQRFVRKSVMLEKYAPDMKRYDSLDFEKLYQAARESRNAYIDAARADLNLDDH